MQIMGYLRYLHNTRPNICCGVDLVSKFIDNPKYSHLLAIKRILSYVLGTKDQELLFTNNTCSIRKGILGYLNNDWCGDQYGKKSITSYAFKFCNTIFFIKLKEITYCGIILLLC